MKYPLAHVNRLIELYGGDFALAYDIFCAFIKTLERSSLAPKVLEAHIRGVVPAFHGHAHNRRCQVYWHPLFVHGVGMEDFEECERFFSKSNHLAPSTRFASEFHRCQQILQHFNHHDLDKYAESGMVRHSIL